MPDVTEEELRKEIAKILKNADLAKTSTNKVIQKLEEVLGTELADKKKTIDQIVLDYVNSQTSDDDEDEEDEEEEEEEEPKKKPPKRSATTNKRAKRTRKTVATSEEDDDDEDDSNDSEYEEEKPKPKKAAAKGKKAGGGKGSGRGKGGGYTRAYKLSPALADLMGAPEMPRHEVVKRMWAVIKEKQLYDPNNKQFAICDDALYKVIGTKRFRIFGMMKYLKSHFIDE